MPRALHADIGVVARSGRVWFSILQRRVLALGVHRSTYALEQALRRYIATTNEHPKDFGWAKTADEILASVVRFWQRTSASHR